MARATKKAQQEQLAASTQAKQEETPQQGAEAKVEKMLTALAEPPTDWLRGIAGELRELKAYVREAAAAIIWRYKEETTLNATIDAGFTTVNRTIAHEMAELRKAILSVGVAMASNGPVRLREEPSDAELARAVERSVTGGDDTSEQRPPGEPVVMKQNPVVDQGTPTPEDPPAKAEPKKEAAGTVNYAQVKDAILAYAARHDRAAVLAVLAKFGAQSGKELKPGQYEAALQAFSE